MEHVRKIVDEKLAGIGECPLGYDWKELPFDDDRQWCHAVICIWDADFDDWERIVQWFTDEGATLDSITRIEQRNLEFFIGDKLRKGKPDDVAQPVLVQYTMPKEKE